MNRENWRQIKEILQSAWERPPVEREKFLAEKCAGDESLRREVEILLNSFENVGSFMEGGAIGAVAETFAGDEKNLTAGESFAHYKIIELLGTGGMGEVYLAKDSQLKRLAALKVLPSAVARDAGRMHRFVQEARAASALNHPNILTIYEIGESLGLRFIAAEYVQGETLRERLSCENLSLSDALDIAIQIAAALKAAHSSGIIHRDIKPENVMIRADGIVKVLDFGLAKLSEPPDPASGLNIDTKAPTIAQVKTQSGMILGTVAYMSPEQARGKAVDARSDIFSLGIVLYEMLTGFNPFKSETTADILAAVLHREPVSLSVVKPDVPEELSRLVAKTLHKDCAERYQSAKELLTDLKTLQKRLEFEAESFREEGKEKKGEKEKRRKGEEEKEIVLLDISPSPRLPVSPSQLPPNNLTENLSPIIGREKEIAEITELLKRDDARLLTLTGVGGTGKTRLAREVAHRMLKDFSDGVFFVELASITQPELVAASIAQPLGVKEAGGKPILEILGDYLRERNLLLVIDNFEQVIDAAPNIAKLLAAANRLKILVTSRALLYLSKEREYIVPPLDMPTEAASVSLAELSNYEAVKLFVERARGAKPKFALSEENAGSVAEICARLDGLPLAIELAAARIKILSPQMILTKLENSLKLLTGGSRDLPARQQTMSAAVQWSYELLSEDEKCLFRRLSVFAGGFTLETAESVTEGEKGRSGEAKIDSGASKNLGISDENGKNGEENPVAPNISPSPLLPVSLSVLDGITSLVDKSLLVSKEQSDGEARFRMLEVVREYALEFLETSGEAETARRRHAEYFLALGEEAEPHLQGAESIAWLDRLEAEHDNLRAALRWVLEHDAGKAAALAAAIRNFWILHCHFTEGRESLKAALERGSLDAPSAVRFKLLNVLGLLARMQGDYSAARKLYEGSLVEGKTANDLRQIAISVRGSGAVAYHQGDLTSARKFIEEGLAISRQLDDRSGIAFSLNMLGDLARAEGDNAAARPLYDEPLAIFKQLNNKQAISANLNNLGAVAFAAGDFAAARSHFAEGLATAQEIGQKSIASYSLDGFAALAVVRGEQELASQLAGAADRLREQIGYEIEPAERRFRDAYLSELQAKMDEAAFARAYEQGRKLKLEESFALALEENAVKES